MRAPGTMVIFREVWDLEKFVVCRIWGFLIEEGVWN
jgi:hypothetical protein